MRGRYSSFIIGSSELITFDIEYKYRGKNILECQEILDLNSIKLTV